MLRTIAVIMGGGRGTRLYPLTGERAKPAVPLAGKYRLIDIPLSNCINSGLRHISVLTQFNTASLHRHIRTTYNFDTFSHGYVNILAAEQTMDSDAWYQGTADAVRKNLRHLHLETTENVLILSGDQLYRMDFRRLLEVHEDNDADATLAVLPVARDQASALGVLKTNGQRIVDFVEKPGDPETLDRMALEHPLGERTHLASMGIYVFKREVLEALLAEEDKEDFGKQIIPQAIKTRRVCAYTFDDYWADIGTIRSFYEANLELTHAHPRFNFYDEEAPIYTHPRNLPPAKINRCTLEASVLADGSILDECEISGSLIGVRTIIGRGTTIKHSVVMGCDYFESEARRLDNQATIPLGIGRNCQITHALLDKNCRLGDGVIITDKTGAEDCDEELYCIRDGIVVIPRGRTVPSGTII